MAFENFTVNVVSFPATVGLDWTNSYSQIVLTITPDTGYSIDASNFSAINPLPNYVSSVTFTQNGANIDCVIVYTSPSIMPAADVLIALCIQGYASETPIVIVGTTKSGGLTNVSIPAPGDFPISFNGSGEWDSSLTVFTQAVVASPGYYFQTMPNLAIAKGNIKEYTVTNIKTFDSENRLVQVVFSVSYKFPVDDVSGDEFVLTANAIEYYDPAVKIIAYKFNSQTVIQQAGETRTFTIYGIEGANWDLRCNYSPGNISIVNTSGTIDATGQAVVEVVFPATTNVNRTYNFSLTGDLASSFNTVNGQTSTPYVAQYIQSSLGLIFTSTDPAITPGPLSIRYYQPFGLSLTVEYTVTATSTQTFTIANNPQPGLNWTGQGQPVAPQNFVYSMQGQTFEVNNLASPSTLTATVLVEVNVPGSLSKTSTLDLDNVLI
tara:strand:+ start:2943 stop:4247 length:1305 start_codon:yes stop_codon:yes gene_type:complete